MIFFYKGNQKGFSLLEIIVAIFFVSVVLVPMVGVVSFTISANRYANHRLIAANLAQEGIEIVRNVRDSNTDWSVWYGAAWSGDYSVDYSAGTLLPYNNTPLKLNADGFYNYNSGMPTIFSRKLTLGAVSNNMVRVLSIITWKEGTVNQSIIVEDELYNWK